MSKRWQTISHREKIFSQAGLKTGTKRSIIYIDIKRINLDAPVEEQEMMPYGMHR